MKRAVVIRPVALEEITEAADWYERRRAGLGAEFLRVLDAAVASVSRVPEEYPKIHGEMRHAVMRRFPYSIIFKASDEEIVVLACNHWRRDPRTWQERR